ncbi:MAG: tetratricopeptide repeat protein [Defluviitaleaceae bacterium]|nr:tetratricopeptide repeat protein [Defluviitaleaceae bacterium]
MKTKNFLIVVVTVLSFMVFRQFGLDIPIILAIYGGVILVSCVVFRAGLLYFMGNVAFTVGKRELAKQRFLKAERHGSKNPMNYLNYAVLQIQDDAPAPAMEYALKALDVNSKLKLPVEIVDKNSNFVIASSHWQQGNLAMAIDVLEGLCKRYEHVNTNVYTSLGFLYFLNGDIEKAKATTEKVLADKPETAAAWDNMGQIYLSEGNKAEAKNCFEKAVSLDRDLADSTFLLAAMYEEAGDARMAAEFYLRAKGCKVTKLNKVTQRQIDAKYEEYLYVAFDEDCDEEESGGGNEADI